MLDIRFLLRNYEMVERKLRARDPSINLDGLSELVERQKQLYELQQLQEERNRISKQIGNLRLNGQEIPEDLNRRAAEVKSSIHYLKEQTNHELGERTQEFVAGLPNIPHDTVPMSAKKVDYGVVREFGEKRNFDFKAKNHVQLGNELGLLDFERAAKLSSSGFAMYTGLGALLEKALIDFFIDRVTSKGFEFVIPPMMVNKDTQYVAGTLPKFEDQLYKIDGDGFYLIPTSEVCLVGMYRNETFRIEDLPKRVTSYTACYRREAGAAGRRDRGLIRLHQFNKVEMVVLDTPEHSYETLEEMVDIADSIVQELGLHSRTVLLAAGDMGQQSAKTYDVEVWLPGQNGYYEVSSISNCESYQARRGNIRFKGNNSEKAQFVHTLNGSALATSRVFPAILENYQQEDGSVIIPEKLRPYFGGREVIKP